MRERWKPAYGFEEHYAVSDLGRVKRTAASTGTRVDKMLKPWRCDDDRPTVSLSVKCKITKIRLSRLVCLSWHGTPPTPKHQAAHWDGDHNNNTKGNLRWATQAENEQDKKRHGRWNHAPKGSKHVCAKLTENDVKEIRRKRKNGLSYSKIAKPYGVGWSAIRDIIKGSTWKHV